MAKNRNVGPLCLLVLSAVISLTAQTPGNDVQAESQRFLNDKVALWKERLNLNDWRISVVPTRRADLKPKTLGGIRWDKPSKSAVIWVLDPADYRLALNEMLRDMELTIVHELVHLELAALPRSEASRSTEERAVNGIAEALLKLDRQKPPDPSGAVPK
jgi:hypothetical protein